MPPPGPEASGPVVGSAPAGDHTNEEITVGNAPPPARGVSLARAADEFVLTTALLFLAVTVVRWLRDPGSPLYIADLRIALVVIGAISGAILTGLILSPPGRRSGGHTNPAVTVGLWLMGAFPGRRVLPYVLAQLTGSAAGTGLAGLVWGSAVALPSVSHAAIRPAPTWRPLPVFLAEVGGMFALTLVIAFFVVYPRFIRGLAPVIGLSVGLVIATLGPLSGGSVNPARQFGPAVLSGRTTDFVSYMVAPVLGAALGAGLHRLPLRRRDRVPTTAAAPDAPNAPRAAPPAARPASGTTRR